MVGKPPSTFEGFSGTSFTSFAGGVLKRMKKPSVLRGALGTLKELEFSSPVCSGDRLTSSSWILREYSSLILHREIFYLG